MAASGQPSPHGTPQDPASRPLDIQRALELHLAGLRAFLRARAGPAVRARLGDSDLVQSVCREVLEDAPRAHFPNDAAFRGWLYTAALRKLVEKKRRLTADKRDIARERPLDGGTDDEAGPLDALASMVTPSMVARGRESVEQLDAALDQLSDEQREVLVLARMVGLSHAEIAVQTGRTEEACRQILRRALLKLAGELQRRGFDVGQG
ncbi:MAG: RNA polymerase sigma factor [Planctomycetia bacterium]|jgi:RNA polymerase sigma factor (sigma-70 family)